VNTVAKFQALAQAFSAPAELSFEETGWRVGRVSLAGSRLRAGR
jgi:hypothetical protein